MRTRVRRLDDLVPMNLSANAGIRIIPKRDWGYLVLRLFEWSPPRNGPCSLKRWRALYIDPHVCGGRAQAYDTESVMTRGWAWLVRHRRCVDATYSRARRLSARVPRTHGTETRPMGGARVRWQYLSASRSYCGNGMKVGQPQHQSLRHDSALN